MTNIILLGFVSFFSDLSSEMVYPLIPLYLTGAFGATPVLLGIIEGIAESVASLLKVYSGYVTDKYFNRKPVAFLGYAGGLVYKVALIWAASWTGILFARIIDRIGKGIRTAPRDALVAESADSAHMGKSFGIHKALDKAGSALGILFAYLLLADTVGAFDYKKVFALSAIPAVLGLFALLFVKEEKMKKTASKEIEKERFWHNLKNIDGNLKLYLAIAFIFTLGNSSNAFLLLRANNIGFSDMNVVLLYLVYNLTAALLAIPFGKLSDKLGRKCVLVAGYLIFSAVYLGFAFSNHQTTFILLFVLYGFYTAMISGVERAMITEIAPQNLKGTMLGLHATVVGVALLPASVIAGLLWYKIGPAAPFVFGAVLSLAAALILVVLFNKLGPGKSLYECIRSKS